MTMLTTDPSDPKRQSEYQYKSRPSSLLTNGLFFIFSEKSSVQSTKKQINKEELWFGEDIDDESFAKAYGVTKLKTADGTQMTKTTLKEAMVKQMNAVEGDKAKYVVSLIGL